MESEQDMDLTPEDTEADGVAETDDPEGEDALVAIEGDEDLSAVFRLRGKQFKARTGDFVLAPFDSSWADFDPGDEWTLKVDDVLLAMNDRTLVGSPTIDGAVVSLEPMVDVPGPKTISFKKRRRKHSSKTVRGGRQFYTGYIVRSIDIPGLGQSSLAPGQGGQA